MADYSDNIKLWQKLSEKWSLILLKGKVPIEKNWQRYCTEKRIFHSESFKGHNAGIACGPASKLIVMDIDDPQLFDSVCKDKSWSLTDTFQVQTGSGMQIRLLRLIYSD
jgi:hypothetical protein